MRLESVGAAVAAVAGAACLYAGCGQHLGFGAFLSRHTTTRTRLSSLVVGLVLLAIAVLGFIVP